MQMDLSKMIGYKFFLPDAKEDDKFKRIRLIDYYTYTDNRHKVVILDLEFNESATWDDIELSKYTPLEGEGMIMISEVLNNNQHDIITAGYLISQVQKGKMVPFCVCRQCITDLYYNLMIEKESDMISGMSMNILNIPKGFNFTYMIASDKVVRTKTIIIYKDDLISDILDTYYDFLKLDKFDEVMRNNYKDHCEAFPEAMFLDEHNGWCKSLKKLLIENNFQSDIDEMFGITTVEFNIEDYLEETKVTEDSDSSYLTITEDLKDWLSFLYKLSINKVYVIPYDYDIDTDDLKRSRYFIFRDNQKKLYFFVYTLEGEYKEAELLEKDKQLDFSTKFRINFLNKYKEIHNNLNDDESNIAKPLFTNVINLSDIRGK